MKRPIHEIATDVKRHWKNVYFGAKPYLDAMHQLNAIEDSFYCDSAESVVLYFLANANTFRGADARRIKAELKELLKNA